MSRPRYLALATGVTFAPVPNLLAIGVVGGLFGALARLFGKLGLLFGDLALRFSGAE